MTIDVAAGVLGIEGLDKVEGNMADNPIELPEDEWEYNWHQKSITDFLFWKSGRHGGNLQ